MHKPAVPYARLRRGLTALCAAALCSALPARGDDLQDASKFLKAGQHSQALERVNKALKAKPRDPQARFLKGNIITGQGNTKEAIEIFTKLTQDFPELPEPYNNLAVIYAAQGQYEKARAALEQSIRTHPSYATAYENLGDVYAKLASQAYDKALQLDKSNSTAQSKLNMIRDLFPADPRTAKVAATKPEPPAKVAAAPAYDPTKPTPTTPTANTTEPPAKPAPARPSGKAQDADEVLSYVTAWAKAWSDNDVPGH